MRSIRRLVGFGSLLALVSGTSLANTDYACMTRCQAAGSAFAYCQSVCSYANPGPAPWTRMLPPPVVLGQDLPRIMMERRDQELRQQAVTAQQGVASAQEELLREQARALRLENDRKESAAAGAGSGRLMNPSERLLQLWLAAAQPRMHLYPDFQQVAFAPDVMITDPMIEWMAASMYAADIAYYLGSNKAEAERISRLDSVRLAQEMRAIEAKFIGQE